MDEFHTMFSGFIPLGGIPVERLICPNDSISQEKMDVMYIYLTDETEIALPLLTDRMSRASD